MPVDARLVAPADTRVIVRGLAGWPMSASALFDRLNEQITREHLLHIVGSDPFGAHQHFPILVRIRLSGQVPPRLGFDPGEALRLTRWGSGPDVDHLARAWCATLLVIAPGDDGDTLDTLAPQLAESCLALGGDLPHLAEQLMVWRAVTEEPAIADLARQRGEDHRGEDDGRADPTALLALLLLRAATDPADPRLVGLAQALTEEDLRWPPRRRWRHLVDAIFTPPHPTDINLDRLANILRSSSHR